MRFILFLAVVVNSLDLFVTAIGIHWFGNGEGNPLLAPLARQSWPAFVLLKGALVPLLIAQLYRYRRGTPPLPPPPVGPGTHAPPPALGARRGAPAGA